MLRLRYFFWKNNKKIKQYSGLALVLFLLIGYALYSYIYYIKPASQRTDASCVISTATNGTNTIGDLTDGQVYEQTFLGTEKGVSAIELFLGTYGVKNKGILEVSLIDKADGTVIHTWEKKESKIKDNQGLKLKLKNEIRDTNNKEYIIRITSDENEKDDNLALYQSTDDVYGVGTCSIDGVPQTGDIVFNVYPLSVDNSFLKTMFWCICMIELLLLIYVWLKVFSGKDYSLESIFVPFMLIIGMVYMWALPPFSAPDETTHFVAAYDISNQILGVENPHEDFITVRESDNSDDVLARTPNLSSYRYFTENVFAPNDKTENNTTSTVSSLVEFPMVSHFPQALGITLARVLGLSYAGLLFMGRIFVLLFYTVLVYIAIRITPIGKQILFALSGLPIMLHEVSSFGYDGILTALAFVLIAYLLRLIYKKELINYKDIIVVIVLSVLLAPCKMVYFLIPFIVLLIPKKKYKARWQNFTMKAGTVLLATISAFGSHVGYVAKSSGGANIILWANEEGYTISYVLTHIPQTILVFVATIHEKMEFYMDSLVGGSLSWFDVDIPADLTMVSIILLIISIHENKNCRIKTLHRLVYIGIFLCVVALICASMLLGWTPKSYPYIEGVQGRYFLPAMPLFLIPFINGSEHQEILYKRIVVVGSCIVNYLVILRVLELVVMR